MKNRISAVRPHAPAYRAGIRPGDRLIAIGGKEIHDILDYMYYGYEDDAIFTVEHPDGTSEDFEVRKDFGQDAGLDFEEYLMDKARSCANNCIFCFVDQLPEGMRDTLYFKDDDVRLSFLTGSYITLTNMGEREIQRIIDLKISPINVSIHTMNKALRCMMLGNKNAGKGVDIVRRLAENNIEMNCQIVCCPEINDGDELLYTMRELGTLYPSVNSCSVIPVGLIRLMMTEFQEAVDYCEDKPKGTPFSMATGCASSFMLRELLKIARTKWPEINGRVYEIKNDFFGHSIDVAGLITGRDLINQLKGKELGERVYITNRMLKDGEEIFLDDITLSEASEALGVPIVPLAGSGDAVLSAMMD